MRNKNFQMLAIKRVIVSLSIIFVFFKALAIFAEETDTERLQLELGKIALKLQRISLDLNQMAKMESTYKRRASHMTTSISEVSHIASTISTTLSYEAKLIGLFPHIKYSITSGPPSLRERKEKISKAIYCLDRIVRIKNFLKLMEVHIKLLTSQYSYIENDGILLHIRDIKEMIYSSKTLLKECVKIYTTVANNFLRLQAKK